MLGDGQSVDLFKLYLLVREKGGYERVSRNGLWDLVAEKSGLGSGVGSSVKLVYVKYLDTLDRWLQRKVKDKDPIGSLGDTSTDLSGLMELEDNIKEYEEYPHLDLEKNGLGLLDVGKLCNDSEVGNAKNGDNGKDDMGSNRKRKRECNQRMLDWVTKVAKNPCDPEVGSIPERHKWRCYGTEQLWKQVLLAREAIFLERNAGISSEQSNSYWSMKQKMHPSMYDDHIGSEKLRCSVRLVSAKESRAVSSKKSNAPRSCSESSSSTQSDLKDHFDKESTPLSADSWVGWFSDSHRKRIPVGPLFQAKVLEWTGETYEDDSRWLGSQIWPLKDGESNKHLIERERIGKGRQDSCGCQYPGSAECVRFHTAEKRMRVKLELGLAFHRWKFDKIGEEVALSWTKEEEKKFQAIIKSNPPSLNKCFWDEMFNAFPSKSREDLVSYYFNVYLLQRRGCQNRSTTPSNIDSDDEESEFVLLSNRFGHGAATSRSSIFRSPKKAHLNSR
ncbi:AT-rich interactive domain-containing protein 1-like isoform X2 [Actinidia eriantha]|nr:AT-rich interactive domain-containing protein 1-like isoform X2 [Actinidia eriantha]XP_057496085.1 AT-rich interactive domain-containing protein 1-like isoform X2 [Actinidia eriantha]